MLSLYFAETLSFSIISTDKPVPLYTELLYAEPEPTFIIILYYYLWVSWMDGLCCYGC